MFEIIKDIFTVFVYVFVTFWTVWNVVVMIHNDNEEIKYHNMKNDWDPRYTGMFSFKKKGAR